MNNLLVAGCSVSDYTEVEQTYGEHLAKHLNLNYIHRAAGCGSNWRMWRVIFDAVNNNIITPEDLIIVQYTEITRTEFWSDTSGNWTLEDPLDTGGVMIRWKMDAHEWTPNINSRQLFREYLKHIDLNVEWNKFVQQHTMFQCFMKERGFKNLYFLVAPGYSFKDAKANRNVIVEDFYKDNVISYNRMFRHANADGFHMNETGHDLLGKHLAQMFLT